MSWRHGCVCIRLGIPLFFQDLYPRYICQRCQTLSQGAWGKGTGGGICQPYTQQSWNTMWHPWNFLCTSFNCIYRSHHTLFQSLSHSNSFLCVRYLHLEVNEPFCWECILTVHSPWRGETTLAATRTGLLECPLQPYTIHISYICTYHSFKLAVK